MNDEPLVPWFVFGDFNEILFSYEKRGELLRNVRQMRGFRSALEDCGLEDLGFEGAWYTWERGRFAETNIRERPDRAVANEPWSSLFRLYRVMHFDHSFSDHRPIVVDTVVDRSRTRTWHFKFEAAWLFEESRVDEVAKLWRGSNGPILQQLAHVSRGLDSWFKKIRHEKRISMVSLRKRLAEFSLLTTTDVVLEDVINAKLQLNMEIDREKKNWE